MSNREFVCTYNYPDDEGVLLLRKHRWRLDPPVNGHTKTFQMQARGHPLSMCWYPPTAYADLQDYFNALLYQQAVLRERPDELWWCEGCKDADTATKLGLAAISHWQGAITGRKFLKLEPAVVRFRGFRGRITIVADRGAVGAEDAFWRYELLSGVGIPPKRLRVVRTPLGRKGADLTDHVEAGLRLDQLDTVPLSTVRKLAAKNTPARRKSAGYS